MKSIIFSFIMVYLFSFPALALSERALKILNKRNVITGKEVPVDYLVVACDYVDLMNDRKSTGKRILLKQKKSSIDKYTGSKLIAKENFDGAKFAEFEVREVYGKIDLTVKDEKIRNNRFDDLWKGSKPKGNSTLDMNSLGHFTFDLGDEFDGRDIVFKRPNPERAYLMSSEDTFRRIHLSCQFFTMPLEENNLKRSTSLDGEDCTVGPADPDCEPLETDSDS